MMRTVWRWLGKGVAAAVTLVLLYQVWLFAHVLWWIDHNPASTSFMHTRWPLPQAALEGWSELISPFQGLGTLVDG